MDILKNLKSKIPQYARDYANRIASSIESKAIKNLAEAIPYLSDLQDIPAIYSTEKYDKSNIEFEITLSGKQVAFLDFGTGVYNQPYLVGVGGYTPDIVNNSSIAGSRGTYEKGKGSKYQWVFVPTNAKNVSTINGDYIVDTRVYHRKRDGGISYYPLKKPVIITKGIPPNRVSSRTFVIVL